MPLPCLRLDSEKRSSGLMSLSLCHSGLFSFMSASPSLISIIKQHLLPNQFRYLHCLHLMIKSTLNDILIQTEFYFFIYICLEFSLKPALLSVCLPCLPELQASIVFYFIWKSSVFSSQCSSTPGAPKPPNYSQQSPATPLNTYIYSMYQSRLFLNLNNRKAQVLRNDLGVTKLLAYIEGSFALATLIIKPPLFAQLGTVHPKKLFLVCEITPALCL